MTSTSATGPSGRHADDAARLTDLVASATGSDWARPSPVPGWTALDVVQHFVAWPRSFLAGAGIELGPLDVAADPLAAWTTHVADVQSVLDHPAGRVLRNPHTGDKPVEDALDQYYTNDVWMHSWDLAKALGREPDLDQERCLATLAGMRPIDELLRSSGQFGPAVAVPEGASGQDQLMAFLGRDPFWRP